MEIANKEKSLTLQQAKFLSQLQVTVGVEVGKLLVSADKLIDLLPGQIFEFEFDPLLPVTLRLGQETIAQARFILQGDQLSLEIISESIDEKQIM